MSNTFSVVFLVALMLMVVLRRWLAQRQIAHVLAHRAAVPAQFAGFLELPAHQKAADYAIAQTKFGRITLAIEVAGRRYYLMKARTLACTRTAEAPIEALCRRLLAGPAAFDYTPHDAPPPPPGVPYECPASSIPKLP